MFAVKTKQGLVLSHDLKIEHSKTGNIESVTKQLKKLNWVGISIPLHAKAVY